MNGEIRHLSDKLPITQPSPEPENDIREDIGQQESPEEEIPDKAEHHIDTHKVQSESVEEEEYLDYEHISNENVEQLWTSQEDFLCSECNFSFSTQENYTIHLKNIHQKSELNEVSPGNIDNSKDQSEPSKYEIVESNHQKGVEQRWKTIMGEMGARKFKCEKCPFISSYVGNIKVHIKQVHDKIRNHVCGECDYASLFKTSLKRHMQLAHGIGLRYKQIIKCEKCSYTTAVPSHLKSHVEGVHEKIRNHVCGDCGFAASQKSNLNKHKNMVHGRAEKRFKCDNCPFKAFFNSQVKKHIAEVHLSIRDQ